MRGPQALRDCVRTSLAPTTLRASTRSSFVSARPASVSNAAQRRYRTVSAGIIRATHNSEKLKKQLSVTKWDPQKEAATAASNSNKLSKALQDLFGRLRYQYYNWRKDIFSDLQVFVAINIALLLLAAAFKHAVLQSRPFQAASDWWDSLYDMFVLTLGQEFPDMDVSNFAEQVFSVVMAIGGLVGFAIILALAEQAFMAILDSNVKRGSDVYEKGHIVVLLWAHSPRDLELLNKILMQVCLAYRGRGGKTVVVLSSREKLELEERFRQSIPESHRYGSKFVFRQGSPLVEANLRSVAASAAQACIVVSDNSRSPVEADCQSLRCAVLLDELDFPGAGQPDPRRGHVVVELKTLDALPLVRYACSPRIVPLPSYQLASRRIANMIRRPVTAVVADMLWNFESPAKAFVMEFPELVGQRWEDVVARFADASLFGIFNAAEDRTVLNPSRDYRMATGDALCMMRPTNILDYKPLPQPVDVDIGDWTPCSKSSEPPQPDFSVLATIDGFEGADYDAAEFRAQLRACLAGQQSASTPSSGNGFDTSTQFATLSSSRSPTQNGTNISGLYMLPLEYTAAKIDETVTPQRVLVCGWSEVALMQDLILELDHGPAPLPIGSEITFFNDHAEDETLGRALKGVELRHICVGHVRGDPLCRSDLRSKLDITSYKCALLFADERWMDPDDDVSNGIEMFERRDLLRLDSMLMTMQLNIRKCLEEAMHPEINIICEKLAFEGVTRYEDGTRLPLGITINNKGYIANILTHAAWNVKCLRPYTKLGEQVEPAVIDAAMLSSESEMLSYWHLVMRALRMEMTLFGYYELPVRLDQPLNVVCNPMGENTRSRPRVWNYGDGRVKLLVLKNKAQSKATPKPKTQNGSEQPAPNSQHDYRLSSGSYDQDVRAAATLQGVFASADDSDDGSNKAQPATAQSDRAETSSKDGEAVVRRSKDQSMDELECPLDNVTVPPTVLSTDEVSATPLPHTERRQV